MNPESPGAVATAELQDLMNMPTSGLGSLPGTPLFWKVWGSHSHNTALPESDHDYLVIYIAPTDSILGLTPVKETMTRKDPDVEAHEVGKFCRLLLKGNPSMVECLFTEKRCTLVAGREGWNPWHELRGVRRAFLSRRVVQQYVGYGMGQLRRFDAGSRLHTKGGKQNEKWLYHMIRVLLDGERIASGGEPVVWKTSRERKRLMAIRSGETPPKTVIADAWALINDIDATDMKLPEEGDAALLNDWLLKIRKEN